MDKNDEKWLIFGLAFGFLAVLVPVFGLLFGFGSDFGSIFSLSFGFGAILMVGSFLLLVDRHSE